MPGLYFKIFNIDNMHELNMKWKQLLFCIIVECMYVPKRYLWIVGNTIIVLYIFNQSKVYEWGCNLRTARKGRVN